MGQGSIARCTHLLATAALLAIAATPVTAAPSTRSRVEICAQALGAALDQLAAQTGRQMLYDPTLVRGKKARPLAGHYSATDALTALLRGSGLGFRETARGVLVIVAGAATSPEAAATPAQAVGQDSGGTLSETPSVGDPAQMEDIVVTANKRSQRLRDVPGSITAETGEALARRGAVQLEDIVAHTPGLYNPGGGGSANNLVMRGVTTGTSAGLQQSTVSLLLDDIEVDPGAGFFVRTNLKIVDVERVEVLRGPQGTLFGSGALSGAVRFLSNKPDLAHAGGTFSTTLSSTRDGDTSLVTTAVANVPIVENKLGARLVGYTYDNGGWVDSRLTDRRDVNNEQTAGGRLMVSAKPNDRLSLLFTAIYQDIDQRGSGESFYATQPGAGDWRREEGSTHYYKTRVKSAIFNLAGTYETGFGTITSLTSYVDRKALQLSDNSAYVTQLGLLFGIPGLTGDAPRLTPSATRVFNQEIRIASHNQGPLRWTIGGFYQSLDANATLSIVADALKPLLGTARLAYLATDTTQIQAALFGEVTYTIGNRIDLTAGLRYSRNTLRFSTISSGIAATGNPDPTAIITSRDSQRETATNPRFAITYRPTRDLMIYAQAARGFRTGGPNVTAALGGGGDVVPLSYGSDSLWNYEVGQKARLFGGAVQLNLAAYYIDWKNIQTGLEIADVSYTGNAGSAKVYGVEVELAARPLAWLEMGGSISANHGELTQDVANLTRVTGLTGVRSGERLPAAPELQISDYAQASFKLVGHETYLRGSHQYVGRAFTDFGEQGLGFGNYHQVDLRAGIRFGGIEVSGFVNNLLDGNGATSAIEAAYLGPVLFSPALAFRIRPRTAGLSLHASF